MKIQEKLKLFQIMQKQLPVDTLVKNLAEPTRTEEISLLFTTDGNLWTKRSNLWKSSWKNAEQYQNHCNSLESF